MTTVAVPPPPTAADTRSLQRITLAGIVLVVTVIAVEALAVATTMPTVARELHGVSFYGWSFTAFLLADIVGMVDAGARVDRSGPRASLVGGLVLFAAGLVVDGLAPNMTVFMVGRTLQGLGAGSQIVALYVLVAQVFPEARRPRVFAAMSAAWVVPALVGPALAGIVTDTVGWRWVFLGIAPLAAVGAVMLVPVMRSSRRVDSGLSERRLGTLGGLLLALGLGLLQAAGQRHDLLSVALVAAGIPLLMVPLRRLLPPGALQLRPGLPAVVAMRGMLALTFFGAEAYLPLTLARLHGGNPTIVGIPLTVAAIGWSLGSWWQGRPGVADRPVQLMRMGFALVGIGVAGLVVLSWPSVTLWLAAPLWAIAGTGMGMAYPTVGVLTLRLSPEAEQGANSAALQAADMTGSILGVALAATLVAAGGVGHLASAIRIADPLLATVAAVGAVTAGRIVVAVRR